MFYNRDSAAWQLTICKCRTIFLAGVLRSLLWDNYGELAEATKAAVGAPCCLAHKTRALTPARLSSALQGTAKEVEAKAGGDADEAEEKAPQSRRPRRA
jgi:hypothetical protein